MNADAAACLFRRSCLSAFLIACFCVNLSALAWQSNLAPPAPPPTPTPDPAPTPDPVPTPPDPAPPKPGEPEPAEQEPAQELPDGKQIVHDSLAAFGNEQQRKELETVEIQAVLQRPMGEIKFHLRSAKDGAFYLVQNMPDQPETIVAFDGKVGWMQNSEMGYQVVDEASVQEGRNQFNTFFPYWLLMFPDEHFKTYETVERTKLGEFECYKVRLSPEDRQPMKRYGYYDVNEKIVRGMGIEQDTPLGTMTVDFIYSDWKPFGDVKCFTKIMIQQGGQEIELVYSTVEFNKVDRSVFELPDAVKQIVQKQQQEQAGEEAKPASPSEPKPGDEPKPDPDPTPEPEPEPEPDPDPTPSL